MLKNRLIMILLLVMILSSITSLTALSDEDYSIINEKHEFNTNQFVFEYNDHNTTTYEGDSGLKGAYANNTVDNYTYFLPDENVRGIAYATKGTFKLKENIVVTHSLMVDNGRYDCIMLKMYYKNDTPILTLDIKDNGLTAEQKSYFDNYDQQKSEYMQQQNQYALEDIYDEQIRANSRSSQRHYSYYFGSNGRGIIYSP
ncbi:MAG: hypothetical protein E7Z84_08505 [Methanosphaera stadtmanae]|nr:hypothetical protein [Methanosphaera stadtmanae]